MPYVTDRQAEGRAMPVMRPTRTAAQQGGGDCWGHLGVVKSMRVMLMRSPRCSSIRHGHVSEP